MRIEEKFARTRMDSAYTGLQFTCGRVLLMGKNFGDIYFGRKRDLSAHANMHRILAETKSEQLVKTPRYNQQ